MMNKMKMNYLKKIALLLAVVGLMFSVSCGSDDGGDSSVDLSEVSFPFDASNPPIDPTIINNLNSSSDQNALQISSSLTVANAMTTWISLFDQPTGAEQSTVPISSCGGNAIVYTYSATTTGSPTTYTVSYQICETSDKYIFQLFFSENGSTPQQFIYAEQSKSGSNGYMEVYGTAFGSSSVSTDPILRYTWAENGDGSFTFTVSDATGGFLYTIEVNADGSGTLDYQLNGKPYYEATWNASGTSGTYTYYDADGSVLDSGTWP